MRYVIGIDEVGRGALAGPVAVGVSVISRETSWELPAGLRDSKLLSEVARVRVAPLAKSWSLHSVVGEATPAEVDAKGITACLGLAGKRALVQLHDLGIDILDSMILLDGSHDWLNPALTKRLRVTTRVKADRDCAVVAAASVVSKVHRDTLLIERDAVTPGYGWASNKGYGSAAHLEAIATLGPTDYHRHSWLKQPALL